jgi:hypothetical protein
MVEVALGRGGLGLGGGAVLVFMDFFDLTFELVNVLHVIVEVVIGKGIAGAKLRKRVRPIGLQMVLM